MNAFEKLNEMMKDQPIVPAMPGDWTMDMPVAVIPPGQEGKVDPTDGVIGWRGRFVRVMAVDGDRLNVFIGSPAGNGEDWQDIMCYPVVKIMMYDRPVFAYRTSGEK